jgi:hypothetical protein
MGRRRSGRERSTGGKVIIDATKPPLCAGKEARLPFERLKPMGWETVRLDDFLPK